MPVARGTCRLSVSGCSTIGCSYGAEGCRRSYASGERVWGRRIQHESGWTEHLGLRSAHGSRRTVYEPVGVKTGGELYKYVDADEARPDKR